MDALAPIDPGAADQLAGVIPDSWWSLLAPMVATPRFAALASYLDAERKRGVMFYPPEGLVFRALELTPPDTVRAVILGQDPYHGPGQAHGLAFSVPDHVKAPPSLRNIIRELKT